MSEEKEETPTIIGPSFILGNSPIIMLEEVYDPKDKFVGFAVWDGEKAKVVDVYEHEGIIYAPRVDDGIKKSIILLPTKPSDFKNTQILLNEIKAFINAWLDVSSNYLEFATWYVLLTWVYDRLNVLPYLRTIGDFSTGKSRFLDTIGGVCYRAMNASGATTAAAVARLIELWKGTLILNEADWEKSDERQDIVRILNEGFENQRAVVKAHQDKQKELIYYDVFGPKILSTRHQFDDPALESRCLTCVMEETRRSDIPPILVKAFFEDRQKLINKLLMFRFKFWSIITEEPLNTIFPKLLEQGIERRLIQSTIMFSVLFAQDEQLLSRFVDFLKHYQEELREERAATIEGMIINAIFKLGIDGQTDISSQKIAEAMPDFGWQGTKEQPYPNPRTVGKRLRELKLETKQARVDGKVLRIIDWNEDQLRRFSLLAEKYIPNIEKCSIVSFVASIARGIGYEQTALDELIKSTQKEGVDATHATKTKTMTPTTDATHATEIVSIAVPPVYVTNATMLQKQGETDATHATESLVTEKSVILVPLKKVKFIIETKPFIGVDERDYGPFLPGDEAEIPSQNAMLMARKGYVVIIEEPQPPKPPEEKEANP